MAPVAGKTCLSFVSSENVIMAGVFEGFTWIRCEGKGSFVISPVLKACAEGRIAVGERCLVVDLGACSGMDSTFMGQLASLASRLTKLGARGGVQIADAGDRNRASLEDLGLDCLLDIEPPDAVWQDRLEEIRENLVPYRGGEVVPTVAERARHVLEAHETLAAASEDNARKFAGVVTVLKQQVADSQNEAG